MKVAQPCPLLLVHGIGDTGSVFNTLIAYLRDRGWFDIHTIDLTPNNGDIGLDRLAQQVRTYVDTHFADAEAIDLIGFSMGGMVSRYYIQRLAGAQRVNHFITLSSPHNGTWTGYVRQNPGVRQMRPGSDFLKDLNDTVHELQQVQFTSLWTPYDLMIVPAKSSQLSVGDMAQLPVLAHPWMLTDQRVLAAIATTLRRSPKPANSAMIEC
ncbi:MAG: triacylglycerol lipase [Cyanobacteria bacterium J06638_28]